MSLAPRSRQENFRAAVAEKFSTDKQFDYRFVLDAPSDTPYKPYEEDKENSDTQIFVEDAAGRSRNLVFLSEQVERLQKTQELARYYFPPELRAEIDALADEHL